MRHGWLSTLAALVACNGLALGQTPEGLTTGQVQQVQATTALPMPGVQSSVPAPIMPTVVNDYGAGSPTVLDQRAEPWLQESQGNRSWLRGEFILWRMGSVALPSGVGVIFTGIDIPVFTKQINQTNDPNLPGIPVTQPVPGGFTAVGQSQTVALTLVPATITVDAGLPGGNAINFRDQPGIQIRAGHWFDEDQTCGIDFNAFFMWKRTINLNAVNDLNLSAPSGEFQSTRTTNIPAAGGENAGVPTTTTEQGPEVQITVNLSSVLRAAASNQAWGFDANLISRPVYFGPLTLDFLGGFRFLDIKQELVRDQVITLGPAGPGQIDPTTGAPPVVGSLGTFDGTTNPLDYLTGDATVLAPTSITLLDDIEARSLFFGVQMGLAFDWEIGYGLYLQGFGKVAIGDMHQRFTLHSNGTGFLINDFENNTEHDTDRICFVPEFNINFGYAFCPGVRVYGGWDIIHISSLAKVNSPLLVATNSSSLTVNDTTVSGSTSSFGFNFQSAKTNIQGLNLGLELRW